MDKTNGQAFILKTQPYLETGLILSLYSLQEGHFSALVKGAKKSKKNWGGKFLLFSKIEYETWGREISDKLNTLIRAESLKAYDLVSPEKYVLASFCAEVFLKLIKNNQPSNRVFYLLENALDTMEKTNSLKSFPLIFLVKILDILGFLPRFSHCSSCHNKFKETSHATWNKADQILCTDCSASSVGNLQFIEIKTLSFIQNRSINESMIIDLSTIQINKLYSILYDELMSHLVKPLMTQKILERLNDE